MKNYFYIIVLCIIAPLSGFAQKKNIAAVKLGETVPDISIRLLSDPNKLVNLKELAKGKLIIIDFWATWCGPCIKALPELQALQEKFKDKLLVVAVNYEKTAVVSKFLSTQKPRINLPIVAEDIELGKMFPHRIIPHEVIIDQSFKFLKTTNADELNVKSLAELLEGKTSSLSDKVDNLKFDFKESLDTKDSSRKKQNLFRAILNKHSDGAPTGCSIDVDKNNKISGYVGTNLTPIQLLTMAYCSFDYQMINKKRTIFDLKDTTNFFIPKGPHVPWSKQNNYCYEFKVDTPTTYNKFFADMLLDLNRYFKIKATTVTKEIDCWNLVRISDTISLKTKGGEASGTYTGKLRNRPVSDLIHYLNRYHDMEPVFDQTSIDYNIDLDTPFISKFELSYYPDMSYLKAYFNKFGLDLVKVRKPYEMLVISDK